MWPQAAAADAAFHLPQTLEVGVGNDVAVELTAFQFGSQEVKMNASMKTFVVLNENALHVILCT